MAEAKSLRAAVFLDRDGTISEEVGYLNHLSRFRMLVCAPGAIRRLKDGGFPVFVATNQSGVARGYFPESLVTQVHAEMNRQLEAAGVKLDGIYCCLHRTEDGCECRKPKPGLLERAAREHGIDLARSVVVGDRYLDMELARRVGAQAVLVRTGFGRGELQWHSADWPSPPDYIAEDLGEAAEWISRNRR